MIEAPIATKYSFLQGLPYFFYFFVLFCNFLSISTQQNKLKIVLSNVSKKNPKNPMFVLYIVKELFSYSPFHTNNNKK